jgi:hypothetical protein
MSLQSAAMERDSSGQRRTILAGIAGNIMEWYDFTVYGFFAAVIGHNFFPHSELSYVADCGIWCFRRGVPDAARRQPDPS